MTSDIELELGLEETMFINFNMHIHTCTVAINKKLMFRFRSTIVERCVLSKKNKPETTMRLFGIRYDIRMQCVAKVMTV